MINDNLIRSLGEQLGRFVSDARSREDMQQSLNAIVQNVFARLDLVTREQFDAQLETTGTSGNGTRAAAGAAHRAGQQPQRLIRQQPATRIRRSAVSLP